MVSLDVYVMCLCCKKKKGSRLVEMWLEVGPSSINWFIDYGGTIKHNSKLDSLHYFI
jgi:hypothetical protein